jgi:hypothetical protein
VLSSLILVCSLAVAQADAPPKPASPPAAPTAAELKAKVLALVRQLDASEQAKREAAEKELIALGPEILPLLPKVDSRTAAEIRNRLSRVTTALMKLGIEAATKPVIVSLSGEMPLSKALAELEKQSGNKLVDYRERFNQEVRDPMVKVELDKVPYWQALDTVLDAAGLTVYNFDEEAAALAYTAKGEEALPRAGRASYSGLFRLEPARIEAVRDLKNPAMRSLKLTADVAWEPRVRPIVLDQPLSEVTALDENGKTIEVDGSEGNLEVPVEGNNSAVELEIPLMAPDRSVKQIASIKGKLTAVVLGKVEAFEFDGLDKLKNAELERGGVIVVVDTVRKNGDIYDVNMRVRFDKSANALESHRGWIYNNECYLLDPKGNQVENAGLEATLLEANEVGLSYKFDLGEGVTPAGHKFVYKTPAAIVKIPVEFELKGIDLP